MKIHHLMILVILILYAGSQRLQHNKVTLDDSISDGTIAQQTEFIRRINQFREKLNQLKTKVAAAQFKTSNELSQSITNLDCFGTERKIAQTPL